MSSLLPLLGDIPSRSMPAVARKGFRPFFLLAGAFAVIAVPFWELVFLGLVGPGTYLDPIAWHAHEMVFGFAVAVISGFLLTAVANWTKRETLVGAPLLGLAAVWVLGRLAMAFAGVLPRGTPASIDLAPGWYRAAILAAAGLWTLAFLLYLLVYVPILARPRVDGKAG